MLCSNAFKSEVGSRNASLNLVLEDFDYSLENILSSNGYCHVRIGIFSKRGLAKACTNTGIGRIVLENWTIVFSGQ